MKIGQLISVQVGLPVTHPPLEPDGKPWRSAIVKKMIDGPVWLRELGLEGDAQADTRVHGGPERAANVYPSEHYELWRQTPGLEDMSGGAFGENFTTRGLLEETVCIGDAYRIGEVVVEVSQPRGPCYKLNRRWHSPDLMERSTESGRIGWYLRVKQAGQVQAGDSIELLERPSPGWTIARVWALMRASSDPAELRDLIEVPGLSEDWRKAVRKQLAGQ